jgi:hypothetical protein
MFNCFLSLFVGVEVSNAYVNVLSITVTFSINFSVLYNRMLHVVVCCFCDSAAQRRLRPPRTTRFRDHTERRATVGIILWTSDQLVADLYLTTHATNIHAPVGFERTIAIGERL